MRLTSARRSLLSSLAFVTALTVLTSCRARSEENTAGLTPAPQPSAPPPAESPAPAPDPAAPPATSVLAREALAQSPAGPIDHSATALPQPLREFGKASLLAATGEQDHPGLQWRADSWPREDSPTLAALAFVTRDTENGTTGLTRAPHVFVLERTAGTIKTRARGEVTIPETSCVNATDNSDLELSIAPTSPQLAAGRSSITVRVTCIRESAGGTISATEIFLFDRQGDRLAQVLDALLDRTAFDRPSGKETTEEGTLKALPSVTSGLNDLLLRVKRVERTALLDPGKDSEENTQRRVLPPSETTYQWTGQRYAKVENP